jgi:hypothetical protein
LEIFENFREIVKNFKKWSEKGFLVKIAFRDGGKS